MWECANVLMSGAAISILIMWECANELMSGAAISILTH